MSRYIDADALLKGKDDHEMISTHTIWNAPTADVRENVRGRWEYVQYDSPQIGNWNCSACRAINVAGTTDFCPNCGADMRTD